MSETVQTTMRVGVSGQFLDNPETFAEISRLFAELSVESNRLQTVESQLWKCNQSAWLISFENQCKRLKRDRQKALPSLVAKLEAEKATLQSSLEKIRHAITELEPSALNAGDTVVRNSLVLPTTISRRRSIDPDVLARNAFVDNNLDKPDREICKILDSELCTREGITRGLPNSWIERHGVSSFSEAYRKCPGLVHTLFSKRRQLKQLP